MSLDSRLQSVFREVFDDPALAISGDFSPTTCADWDSVRHVELLIATEEEFGIKFTTEEAASPANAAQFKTWLRAKGVPE
jgi:acyl carrier protein